MWRPAAYGVPGPWQVEPGQPAARVEAQQDGRGRDLRPDRPGGHPRRADRAPASGIQYHSGRPTRPFLVRGGAVAGAVTGMCSRPLAYSISSRGVILGTPVALETSVTPPNGLLARAGDGRPLLALGRLGQAQEVDLGR